MDKVLEKSKSILLHMPIKHFFGWLIREFRQLMRLEPKRGSVNALTLIIIMILGAFYFFVDPLRHFQEILGSASGEKSGHFEFIAFIFMLCLTAIISIICMPK